VFSVLVYVPVPLFLPSVIMDVVKGWVSASLTLRARELRKEANVLKSQQQRVQEHDIRNEHQVRLNNGKAACSLQPSVRFCGQTF
jgi:hypothetical protein